MQYQSGTSFSLRIEARSPVWCNRGRLAAGFLAIAFCAALSACAENPNYPNLSKITELGNILSPEERQKALQDMQKQEQTHSSDAAKQIEKRDPE
jgi:hypothetical protein